MWFRSVCGWEMWENIHSGLWSSPRASVASSRLRISDFLFSVTRSFVGTTPGDTSQDKIKIAV